MNIALPLALRSACSFLFLSSVAAAYDLKPTLNPDPPKMGKELVTITVKGPDGKPLAKAEVTGEAVMPAMPGMGEMKSQGKPEKKSGASHTLRFNLSMEGTWYLVFLVKDSGKEEKVIYEVTTGKAGARKVSEVPAGAMEEHKHH